MILSGMTTRLSHTLSMIIGDVATIHGAYPEHKTIFSDVVM